MDELLGKWSTPFALATAISGGAAWLTTTRNDVQYLASQVETIQVDLDKFNEKANDQDSRLSRMEAKIDMIIDYMKRQRHDPPPRRQR